MNFNKKTLIVCQRYPLPEDHGNAMRTMNFVRFFKNVDKKPCKVDILCTNLVKNDENRGLFDNEYVISPSAPVGIFKKLFLRVIDQNPSPIFIYSKESINKFVQLVERCDYDYICIRYLHATQLALALPDRYKNRIILDVDDIPSSNIYDINFSRTDLFSHYMSKLNRKLLEKYEKKCIGMGTSLFCSEKDLLEFKTKKNKDNLAIVPNIFRNSTLEDIDLGNGFDADHTLLFVGALGYKPNIEGLRWFINTCFEAFRNEYKNFKLMVVGRNPGKLVRTLCDENKGVELHSNVPDIRPFYKKARAVVVPLLSGGGTRIKILEAALSNRPILSTPIGATGIDLQDKRDILLFSSPKDFIEGYRKLDDPKEYHSVVRRAKMVVEERYSSKNFNKVMKNVIENIDKKNL